MKLRFCRVGVVALVAMTVLAPSARTSYGSEGMDPDAQSAGVARTGDHLVVFADSVGEAAARAIVRSHGLLDGQWIKQLSTLSVRSDGGGATASSLLALAGNDGVLHTERDLPVFGASTPNDLSYGQQWAPSKIGAEQAWDRTTGSSDVVVAVLDTGVDAGHPEFVGKTVAGWDFINSDADPMDDNGHGTHVAGVIGAISNNGEGVASIGGATRIMPVKVLTQYNGGSQATAASGLIWAVDHGARIVNISLGAAAGTQTLQSAVDYAADRGVVVVAAAGNGNTSNPFYPAVYPSVIAVGATSSTDERYKYSNFGDWLDLMAPGVSIYSTNWGPSAYNSRSGTSQATAHVSAVAALLLSVDPGLDAAGVREILQTATVDLGTPGFDTMFGFGRIDAHQAVTAADGSAPGAAAPTSAPPEPTSVPPTVAPPEPTVAPPEPTVAPPEPTVAPPEPTVPPPDPTAALAAVISNVRTTRTERLWARVAWTTDLAATSQVEWGLTTSYGKVTALSSAQVTSHSVDVTNLRRRTTYHYRVRSTVGGVESMSGDFTFRTD